MKFMTLKHDEKLNIFFLAILSICQLATWIKSTKKVLHFTHDRTRSFETFMRKFYDDCYKEERQSKVYYANKKIH